MLKESMSEDQVRKLGLEMLFWRRIFLDALFYCQHNQHEIMPAPILTLLTKYHICSEKGISTEIEQCFNQVDPKGYLREIKLAEKFITDVLALPEDDRFEHIFNFGADLHSELDIDKYSLLYTADEVEPIYRQKHGTRKCYCKYCMDLRQYDIEWFPDENPLTIWRGTLFKNK